MTDEVFNRGLLLVFSSRFLMNEYGEGILDVICDWKNSRVRERWAEIAEETGRSDPEYLYKLFNDAVHEYEVVRKGPEALEVRVTRCAHADVFRGLNATDVGMKMICMGDYAVVEGFNPRMRFSRPKTIMAGDDCCHFVFELE
jgi:predicted ArsR family transcriptional regulator